MKKTYTHCNKQATDPNGKKLFDYQGKPLIPCHDGCPAVTGHNYGSVQFCPMQEWERHRVHETDSECCANFQCCTDLWERSGLTGLKDALIAADEGTGSPVIEVKLPAEVSNIEVTLDTDLPEYDIDE